MKRLFSVIIITLLLITSAAFSAFADSYYIRGDANGDGKRNGLDVTLAQRVLGNLETEAKGIVKRNCDTDVNGLDINDITRIQRYLAEYEDKYQIGKTFSYDEHELPFVPD